MSCAPSRCADCKSSCGSRSAASNANGDDSETHGHGNLQDIENQLKVALERAKKAEDAFNKLKLENSQNVTGKVQELQPLRSQQWFNNRKASPISTMRPRLLTR